jgi:hypothetical protein
MTTGKLKTRLQRLERHTTIDRGCPACRDRRGRHVLLDVTRNPDGTITDPDDAPEACPACGKVPEFIVRAVMSAADEPAFCRAAGGV